MNVGLTGSSENIEFKSQCVDVSRSSIQISCDSSLVQALLANDEYPHTAKLDFSIPGDASQFKVVSQVVTHRRLSQDHYYLVLVFNDFQEGSDEQLANDLREFEPAGFRVDSVK